ncbi:ester cyclase [Ruegeria sp. HKCCD8929]|uniref:ester cyclase n=1 Tax=Ruegeria sp. HKCCD8929 TaxID=2683006 RepID=UPI001487E61C|nr:ester cyclase [Ruegeria sp. HKCCD8929]
MSNLDVIRTWFKRVYADEDMSAVDEMMEPATDAHGLADHPLLGPEEFKGFVRGFLALLGNVDIHIDKSLEHGDWVHMLISIHATCRAIGTPVNFPAQIMVRVIDGVIVEGHNTVDFLSMFSQRGLLPDDAFSRCFSGIRIG